MPSETGDLWVFGYGSLMWEPGFDYVEVEAALLRGYHRSMCILSWHYRGTPDNPGLVLGLDRGGSCRGCAFRIPGDRAPAVQAYLDARELITGTYYPRFLPVLLAGGRRISAYCYITRRDHPQYAGHLTFEQKARLIQAGCGCTGRSRDYLANTLCRMDQMGIPQGALHRLLKLADAMGERDKAPSLG